MYRHKSPTTLFTFRTLARKKSQIFCAQLLFFLPQSSINEVMAKTLSPEISQCLYGRGQPKNSSPGSRPIRSRRVKDSQPEEKNGMIIGQKGGDNRPKVLLEFPVKSLSRIQRGKK
jgi:hypothetical protein